MTVRHRIPVDSSALFPSGVYVVGLTDPECTDACPDGVCVVRILDADPDARKGQEEHEVRIPADYVGSPVIAELTRDRRRVALKGLTATPLLAQGSSPPRIVVVLSATGLDVFTESTASPTEGGEPR